MFVDEVFMMGDEEEAAIGAAPSRTILVKFFNAYEASKINQAPLTSSKPEAHVRSTDVSDNDKDAPIVIRGTTYYIKEIHPDGTGMTVLLLTLDKR